MSRASTAALAAVALALAACGGADTGRPPTTTAEAPTEFEVAVDPRVELLSVLFRLAGAQPYGEASTPYGLAADEHFSGSSDHPAVAASADLVRTNGISYDAVVELAAYLDESFVPATRLDPLPPGLDPRWDGVDIEAYLAKVRRFADEADFAGFEDAQSAYSEKVEEAFASFLAGKPVIDFFDAAFGPIDDASYTVVPGLLTGGFGFGTTAVLPGGTEVADIAFLEAPDSEGVPHPTTRSLEFLVHEFAHSYVNPIFDARTGVMRASAEPLFRAVEQLMRDQAYTTYAIMVNESVVRALTVIYLRERIGEAAAEASLAEQERLGFFWTGELAAAIETELERAGRLEPNALLGLTRDVFRASSQR